jgi:hypothetical protein
MRKIDLSNISTNVGMPIKSGVLSHLQFAYQEAIDAIVKGNIGGEYDPAKFYVLYGCVNSTTAPIYTVSAGAIFYNGEIYLVDAFTFTSTGSNVAVGTINTTFYTGNGTNADPVTFTDGSPHNVLQIRKVVFSSAASASGDVDFSGLFFTNTNKITVGAAGAPPFQNTFANSFSDQMGFFVKNSQLNINGLLDGTLDFTKTIFTLPVGFRPSTKKFGSIIFMDSSSYFKSAILTVETNGDVTTYIYGTYSAYNIVVDITFDLFN